MKKLLKYLLAVLSYWELSRATQNINKKLCQGITCQLITPEDLPVSIRQN